jgi:hypothetical protein
MVVNGVSETAEGSEPLATSRGVSASAPSQRTCADVASRQSDVKVEPERAGNLLFIRRRAAFWIAGVPTGDAPLIDQKDAIFAGGTTDASKDPGRVNSWVASLSRSG